MHGPPKVTISGGDKFLYQHIVNMERMEPLISETT
ncbi:hypothetical protein BVRB_2g040810 [Beta vulgaris subsp. vulgaris]|nr:hypothetical protein BVRB_2g040810 [Beta vulgaris subsp. vulgaris]